MSREQREKEADLKKQAARDDELVTTKRTKFIMYLSCINEAEPIMRVAERHMDEGWCINGGIHTHWTSSLVYSMTLTMNK
jgi:hypothetical protein